MVAILGNGVAIGVTGRSKEGRGVWSHYWAEESGRAWLGEIGTHPCTHLTPILSRAFECQYI